MDAITATVLLAVALVESNLNPAAVSRCGAKGMYQLMDATGLEWHKKLEIQEAYNPFDPVQSKAIAKAYLEWLLQRFKKLPLALAAYNCGPGRFGRALREAQSTELSIVIAYCPKETRDYVAKVMGKINDLDRGRNGGVQEKHRILCALESEADFVQPRSNVGTELVDRFLFETKEQTVMGSIVGWILKKTNGWKSVIGYVLVNVPFLAANPLLITAVQDIASDPYNAQYWGNLVAQGILAAGIIDRVRKNITGVKPV